MTLPGIPIAEFKAMAGAARRPGNRCTKAVADLTKGSPIGDKVFDDDEDYREFNADIKKRQGTYLGLGDEGVTCGRWAMLKKCENGHWLLKTLACGREWCPTCGEDSSEHHGRRIARLVPRVFSMDTVGYFVFEVPLVARQHFESVEVLREARRYIHRLLTREFPQSKGVSRWHYYGDATLNEFTGAMEYVKYHPHLNVLISHGFVGKKQLKRIRRLWSQWVYRRCGKRYYKTAPVYYKYHKAPGKKYHLIRYVTRPTFKQLNDFNIHIAKGLFRFNNTSWFGSFTEAAKESGQERYDRWLETLKPSQRRSVIEVNAHKAFNQNRCPICNGRLEKLPGIDKLNDHQIVQEFGAGLFEIRPPPWAAANDPPIEADSEANCNFW